MTVIKSGTATQETADAHPVLGSYTAQRISDAGNLTQFGALIETLPPGSKSSLMHWHAREDEMIYILSGTGTLYEGAQATQLSQGDAACFKAGDPIGHCLENTSTQDLSYMVIGSRYSDDTVTYPACNRVLIRSAHTQVWTDQEGNPSTSAYDDLV